MYVFFRPGCNGEKDRSTSKPTQRIVRFGGQVSALVILPGILPGSRGGIAMLTWLWSRHEGWISDFEDEKLDELEL